MKQHLRLLVSLLSVFLSVSVISWAGTSTPDTLRVLSVANSFGEDAVEQNLHEIALSDGHIIIIGSMYIGGCPLEKHYLNSVSDDPAYRYRKIGADGVMTEHKHMRMSECFADEPWDVVVTQQSSPLSGIVESYEPYLGELVRYFRAHTPKGAKFMLHQTWAYAQNCISNSGFKNYDYDQSRMYSQLVSAYRTMARKYRMGIIPSGTAVQNSRGTWAGENITRDGYHMSWWYGRYLVACTYYEALFGENVTSNSYTPAHLEQDRIINARRCAHVANLFPDEVHHVPEDAIWENYNPKAIEPYTLPDALVMQDGTPVTSPEQWYSQRRPELLHLFESEEYGRAPQDFKMTFEELSTEPAFGGLAVRHQALIKFNKRSYIQLLVYTPADAQGPVPTFLGVNFGGNVTVSDDPGILPATDIEGRYGIDLRGERGKNAERWPIEQILKRGYGVATYHCADVDPDYDDGGRNGVSRLAFAEGQKSLKDDQWGSIAMWAWGLSRCLDYLQTYDRVDASRVAVLGHSRLGKAALWAGALDDRFAMVISNDSGCCGAALSMRRIGETVHSINRHFPHWFCANFKKYDSNESSMPFDQHELLACVAPRPLYIASAEQDGWSDPVGERLSEQEAARVYRFLGLDDQELLGYHMREGRHAILMEDWEHYMDFADRHLLNK